MNLELLIELIKYVAPYWVINTGLNLFPLVPWLKKIDFPFDFQQNFWDQKRILGRSTTWLGLIVALLIGISVEIFLTNWRIGILKGLCAFFGHAGGSFIKRRLNIAEGDFLIFVDHLDYIILSGIVFYFLRLEGFTVIILSIPLVFFIHPLLCIIGYNLHLRENKL